MKTKFNSKYIFNKLINNKIVLYIIALVSLFDILGYIMRYEFSAVLFFYLIGMITFNYTKYGCSFRDCINNYIFNASY